jgi:hypothetical protein
MVLSLFSVPSVLQLVRRPRTRRSPGSTGVHRLDVIEPPADDLGEAIAAQAVQARAPFAPHLDEPGFFQEPEVTRGGGPGVLETRGEVA